MRFIPLIFAVATTSFAAEKPDILMIAVDDLRPMLGCYGDARVSTPHIDALAARGVLFENAYCQYAKCGTSRLSLMNGLRPDAIDVYSNNERDVKRFRERRPDAVSLGQWLKDNAGYHTQSWGKIYHDGWDNPEDWSAPSSPGRDREMWEIVDEDAEGQPTIIAERLECPVIQKPDVADDHLFAGRMTNDVIDFLRTRDDIEKPVFLAVGFRRPHLPFVAPKRYFDQVVVKESWLASNSLPSQDAPAMAWFNSDGYVGSAKKIGLTMPVPPTRQEAIEWNGYEMRSYLGVPPHGEISQQTQLQLLQAYAACIQYVDAQIGRLLESVGDDTLVILWSDHGWHLGEHSAWGKMTNYEIATRVPLIISHPDFAPAKTANLAELVDLYPTICDLVGEPAPKHLEGQSLTSILTAPKEETKLNVALSQYSRYKGENMGYAMRTPRYRVVIWEETGSRKVVAREVYDHRNDPLETRNLAEDTELADRLEKSLRNRWEKLNKKDGASDKQLAP